VKRKSRYRRGYPVAVLVGFEADHVTLWQVFSRVVKPFSRLNIEGRRTDEKVIYNFHESVVVALKSLLNEGVRTIVVVSPPRTDYAANFLTHVHKHHKYLTHSKGANRANFATIVGSADDKLTVAELVKTDEFIKLIAETTSEEADQVVNLLEKHLYNEDNGSVVLYSLKEIENRVYRKETEPEYLTEYLLLTNKYLAETKQKSRIHRLMQISKNKKVKTKVVDTETAAGNRINQFGGIVYFSLSSRATI
jgi:stalled ribosome rescue protein Dom34